MPLAGRRKVSVPPTLTAVERSRAVVGRLAGRLRQPDLIDRAVSAQQTQTQFPRTSHWNGASLAQGDAGVAFACGILDAALPEQGWDEAGHYWLLRAVGGPSSNPSSFGRYGLMSGASGLSLAVWQLSRGGTRYRTLRTDLDAAMLPAVHDLAARVTAARHGLANADYDVVSGLAGIVVALLPRNHDRVVAVALDACLDALILLAEPVEPPRWWTPAALTSDRGMRATHPGGYLNLGLAHGVPGIIAALVMAHQCGLRRPGAVAAVERLAIWLRDCKTDDEWGPNWPSAIPAFRAGAAPRPCRGAWCYGTPGISVALWGAADVLGDKDLAALAVESLLAVHRRPATVRNVDSPTVCHGMSGLLQVTRWLADAANDPRLAHAADVILEAVLRAEEPDSIMGYRNLEPGPRAVDHPGLLDGSVGVLLSLFDVTASTSWGRILMLG